MSSDVDVGTGSSWVDLPVQRRFCPIFVNSVGLLGLTSIPRVDWLSTDPRVLGCHKKRVNSKPLDIIKWALLKIGTKT